jgi:hypothetical protein
MRNVQITSNDGEIDQRLAELQPYVETGLTVSVSQPGQRTGDGGTEHSEPVVEDYSQVVPGRELEESATAYNQRLEDYKAAHADFDGLVGNSTVPIVQGVRDEILRAPNGPQIVHFLASYPEVAQGLLNMHPLEAARHVREDMGPDLQRGILPIDGDYESWRRARNPRVRQGKK